MVTGIKKDNLILILSFFCVFLAVVVSLFFHFEMGGETWGYWFFARVFIETGKFIISDRSPLYILYLNLFYWIGYPNSVTIEYIVTTTVAVIALVLFLRKHIGLGWATLAGILWIPFFQMNEPPVQKLALACSLFAVIARQDGSDRLKIMLSYALLGFAFMFRWNYIVLIPLFGGYDLIRLFREKKKKRLLCFHMQSDWPIVIVVALLMWFSVMQSSHSWNNAWTATTKWFPCNGKSLSQASFIQNFNWMYIWGKYKTFENKDFYFTNQELFGGHSDLIGSIYYGRNFITKQLISNTFFNSFRLLELTEFSQIFRNQLLNPRSFKMWFFAFISFFVLIYGAFRLIANSQERNKDLIILFLAGSILLELTNVLSLPKLRYLFPFVPILSLSAYWYATKINDFNNIFNRKLMILLLIVLFSNGLSSWSVIIGNLSNDFAKKDIRILEARPYSMKASFDRLNALSQHKRGILSLENTFVGAFLNTPIKNVYDVWEIPPFGRYGKSDYKGLVSKRIDCVLVSHELATGIGCATNYQMRYQNYIKPYAQKLIAMGAKFHAIPKYGSVVFVVQKNCKRGLICPNQ